MRGKGRKEDSRVGGRVEYGSLGEGRKEKGWGGEMGG